MHIFRGNADHRRLSMRDDRGRGPIRHAATPRQGRSQLHRAFAAGVLSQNRSSRACRILCSPRLKMAAEWPSARSLLVRVASRSPRVGLRGPRGGEVYLSPRPARPHWGTPRRPRAARGKCELVLSEYRRRVGAASFDLCFRWVARVALAHGAPWHSATVSARRHGAELVWSIAPRRFAARTVWTRATQLVL